MGGAQYTYIHQQDCHHSIIFNQFRFLHPKKDAKLKALYPYATFEAVLEIPLCEICDKKAADCTVKGKNIEKQMAACKECIQMYSGPKLRLKIKPIPVNKNVRT